jgi:tetratricopeptide (TPR) repeat protein
VTASIVLLAALAGPAAAVAQTPPAGPGFPTTHWPRDGYELYAPGRWAATDAALERFGTAPLDPETVRALSFAGRPNEMLVALERIARERPDRLAEALTAVEIFPRGDSDEAKASKVRGRALIATARQALPSMPREAQARLAAALLRLEGDVVPDAPRYPELHRRFVAEYAGTTAAALIAIDVMVATAVSPATLSALRDLADSHPRDDVGAKALSALAFQLGHNAGRFDPGGYNAAPVPRFLEVVELVHRLERGAYPDSEWVRKAPEHIARFYFPERKLADADAQRVLAALTADTRARAARWHEPSQRALVETVLTSLLPRVMQQADVGPTAAEAVFDEVAGAASDPDAIRLLQVAYLLSRFYRQPDAGHRATAARILERVAETGGPDGRRRAMAWLGDVALADHRLAEARAHFSRFVAAYPSSDFAWMAAFRIGQIDRTQGQAAAAVEAFRAAAGRAPRSAYPIVVTARALAEALEAAGDPAGALPHYRTALAAWRSDWPGPINPPMGPPVSALPPPADPPSALVTESAATRAERRALVERVDQLARFVVLPGGVALERGRWLRGEGRAAEAIGPLTEVARTRRGTPIGDEAARLRHGAQLDAALSTDGGPGSAAGLAALEALTREPHDEWVGLAGLARATLLKLQGNADAADAAMRTALRAWIGARPSGTAPAPASLDADVVRLRDAVMQLRAGDVADRSWTYLEWPTRTPPFVVLPAALPVSEAGAVEPRRVDVSRPPAGLDNVLFVSDEAIRYLGRLVPILGGTERRQPAGVMAVPNQPAGDARAIIAWWNTHFPTIPGHWMGVEVLTPPAITDIRFSDAARTRALVRITIGYKGGTVVFERVDGVWRPTALIETWIT